MIPHFTLILHVIEIHVLALYRDFMHYLSMVHYFIFVVVHLYYDGIPTLRQNK